MSGFVRGVKLFNIAEYCDTLQSKEKRNWEHKACLNNRALRLLDHEFIDEFWLFTTRENGAIFRVTTTTSAIWKTTQRECLTTLAPILMSFSRSVLSDHFHLALLIFRIIVSMYIKYLKSKLFDYLKRICGAFCCGKLDGTIIMFFRFDVFSIGFDNYIHAGINPTTLTRLR